MTESEAREIVARYDDLLKAVLGQMPEASPSDAARLRIDGGRIVVETYWVETDIGYDGSACGGYLSVESFPVSFFREA